MNNEEKIIALLEEQGKRFDRVDQRLDQVDQRLDQVDQRLNKVDQRLDKVDQRLDKVDQRLDQVDQRLDQVDQRLDKLEADVLGVRVLVDVDIDKKLNLLAEGHSAIIEQMIPVSRVEALESDVVVLKEAIKALSSRLKELEAKTA